MLSRPQIGQVALLRDHAPSLLLARAGSGTLTLTDGPGALRMRADVVRSDLGVGTVELVRWGDLQGMSFGFVIGRDAWYEQKGTRPLRVIEEVAELFDVSVVTHPAYPTMTVALADDCGRRALDLRRLMTETVVASGGAHYGRRCAAPRHMDAWCHQRRVRMGREVVG